MDGLTGGRRASKTKKAWHRDRDDGNENAFFMGGFEGWI